MQLAGARSLASSRTSSAMSPSVRLLQGLPKYGARRIASQLQVFRTYGFEPEKPKQESDLTFTDHAAIFEGRTTSDLLRALLVLRLCASPPFVTHSEALLDTARRTLGDGPAMNVVRETFYKHFCAGLEPADVWSRMNAYRAHGIGAILDYAEEEDLLKHCRPQSKQQEQPKGAGGEGGAAAAKEVAAGGEKVVSAEEPLGGESIIESRVAARTYSYQDEDACERHTAAFLAAIDTAATLPGQGFAAIKLSALGDPRLLEHLSAARESVTKLFRTYDADGDGVVTRAEFDAAYERLMAAQGRCSADERSELWSWLDEDGAGAIDYVSWTHRLDLGKLPELAAGLEAQAVVPGGSSRPWELSTSEQEELGALLRRLDRLVDRAVGKGVKLMIDAEQSSLRPSIEHIAYTLMRTHNIPASPGERPGEAVIFVTYQTYLKDTHQRLKDDLARAQREGYTLGAKLVRGAYLHLERRRAAQLGLPPPVWDRIEQTHACFDSCLDTLIEAVAGGRAEVMIGSHNQGSVEGAVGRMAALGLDPETAPVYFGQLMGMADNLSFTLGHHGYKVFKYCPYGSVEKVIPYLLRRVNENQYILKGGKRDVTLLWAELWRRALHDPTHSPLARVLTALKPGGEGATAANSS